VDYVVIVRVAERRCHVLDDRQGVAEGHAAAELLVEQRIQRLALEVLHQYVEQLAVHVHGMQIDDIRMAELARLANLLAQQCQSLGVQLPLQYLDGESLAGHLLIGGQVHHAHSPLTELAFDAVAPAKQLTGGQPRRDFGLTGRELRGGGDATVVFWGHQSAVRALAAWEKHAPTLPLTANPAKVNGTSNLGSAHS
jgi:hypothetical protein